MLIQNIVGESYNREDPENIKEHGESYIGKMWKFTFTTLADDLLQRNAHKRIMSP